MKRKQYIIAILSFFILYGCTKTEIDNPEFRVSTSGNTFVVGEEVTFHMSGIAGFLWFYSGEFGNEYAYKSGRMLETESVSVEFQTRVQYGNQPDQLSVLISSDFSGEYTVEAMRAATWIDISDHFTYATSTDYLSSGRSDISDLVDREQPLYVAYRYTTRPQSVHGAQRTWTIRGFELHTTTELGEQSLMNQQSGGWTLVQDGEIIESGRSSVSTSSGIITVRGNNGSPETSNMYTESWAISKAVDLRTLNLGPDGSLPIKNMSDNMPEEFKHIYTDPGTYKAVFVAANHEINGAKEVVREIDITITAND